MRRHHRPAERDLRVLVSPDGRQISMGNPYLQRLNRGLELRTGAVVGFDRRRAATGRWDIVHVHFPEHLVRFSGSAMTAMLDVAKVLLALAVARLRGARLVWTAHDLGPHENHRPWLWAGYRRGFVHLVDRVITLDPGAMPALQLAYPGLRGKPVDVVPHGHYKDDYPPPPARSEARHRLGLPAEGRILLLMGLIRRYKNVPETVAAFVATSTDARLVVAGEANVDPGLAEDVRTAAGGDERVVLRLKRVSEAQVSLLHAACNVVVLPYSSGTALNSGAAVLAASQGRVVVVRDSAVMRGLRDLVGKDWVRTFSHGVKEAIDVALATTLPSDDDMPNLAELEWDVVLDRTMRTYDAARRRAPGTCP